MNLDISGASIGYDEAGMKQVYEDIKASLITDVINKINTNIPTLISNVDGYWKGASADAFKAKVKQDSDTLVTALTEIGTALEGELNQMMANVNNSDATVAESIKATMEQ